MIQTHCLKTGHRFPPSNAVEIWTGAMTFRAHTIKEFGAKGDGTDDSDNVQRAVDAAENRQTSYTNLEIYIPPGVYAFSKPVNVSKSLIIRGTYESIFESLNGNYTFFNVTGDFCTFEHLRFRSMASGPAPVSGAAIVLQSGIGSEIRRCAFVRLYMAVSIVSATEVRIHHCRFSQNYGNAAIICTSGTYVSIEKNDFQYNAGRVS
jgi:hypothetical protein